MEDCFEIPELDLLEKKCTICRKVYAHKKSLYSHLRYDHDLEPRPQRKAFPCESCEKAYSSECALKKHIKRYHLGCNAGHVSLELEQQLSALNREHRIVCPHDSCWEKFSHYKHLRCHIIEVHSVEIEMETHEFCSIEDFEFWKQQVQQETTSYYTLDTSGKLLSNGVQKKYFNCYRSYKYKPKGKNIRKLRSCGSNKIGKACPSRMEVTIQNEAVYVKFWSSHYGHNIYQCPLPLDKESKEPSIVRSHKSSLLISRELIEVISEGREWLVSCQNGSQKYCVTLVQQTCLEPCLVCTKCNICVHTFKCSCIENVIKNLICKHIHGIARAFPIQICMGDNIVDEIGSKQFEYTEYQDVDDECLEALSSPNETLVQADLIDQDANNVYTTELAQKADLISKLCGEIELREDKFVFIQDHLDKVISALTEELVESTNKDESVRVEFETIDSRQEELSSLTDQGVLTVHTGFDHTYV